MKNTLVTIDIHDYKNPKILNILKIQSESGLIVSYNKIPDQGDFIILTTFSGIRILPTKLKSKLNVEFFKK